MSQSQKKAFHASSAVVHIQGLISTFGQEEKHSKWKREDGPSRNEYSLMAMALFLDEHILGETQTARKRDSQSCPEFKKIIPNFTL